jgi:hypothetical protein
MNVGEVRILTGNNCISNVAKCVDDAVVYLTNFAQADSLPVHLTCYMSGHVSTSTSEAFAQLRGEHCTN